jgi:hypothetical protein
VQPGCFAPFGSKIRWRGRDARLEDNSLLADIVKSDGVIVVDAGGPSLRCVGGNLSRRLATAVGTVIYSTAMRTDHCDIGLRCTESGVDEARRGTA